MNDEFQSQPLLKNKQENYIQEDEQKSMAILNLQAILNLEDVDKIIQLLEQNNWDESQAASQYYAQQVHDEQRQPNNRNDQMIDESDNVRDPIQFQQEQLIDENQNLIQNIQQLHHMNIIRQRQRQPTYRFISHIENQNNQEEEQQQYGLIYRSFNYVYGTFKSVIGTLWKGLVWLFTFTDQIDQNMTGQEFQQDISRRLQKRHMRLRIQLHERTFNDLCVKCRLEKKPIIIIILRNSKKRTVQFFDRVCQNNMQGIEVINENFNCYGMYASRMDRILEQELNFPQEAMFGLWVLNVQANHNIIIMSRLTGNNEDDFCQEIFLNFLNENLNMYQIMCQEDQEYQAQEILQNAGILPLNNNLQNQYGSQDYMGFENQQIQQDRLLREEQKRELEQAQEMDRQRELQKQQEEMKKQEEIRRKQEEEEQQKMQMEQKKVRLEEMKQKIPEQPEENSKDACSIVFRLPSGERENYRFSKDVKVQVLYDYVESLGDKLQFENSDGKFLLMQSMPKKEFTDKDKSIGEVGLFPRAILQVKEQ